MVCVRSVNAWGDMVENKNNTKMIHCWVGEVEIESNETEERRTQQPKIHTARVRKEGRTHVACGWLVFGGCLHLTLAFAERILSSLTRLLAPFEPASETSFAPPPSPVVMVPLAVAPAPTAPPATPDRARACC